jgi:5,5'-dehydrodivanillate O-demethylase oxygenase subunit
MEATKHVDFEHTGPSTLAGRFLRRFWHPVFVSEDLKPSDAAPLKVMGEELTLYRGEDGVARILEGRCAHRGVVLSVGQVEGDCLRCRYHGWKFDPSGQCVEQPAERKSFAAKVRIASYPVEEYFGFVWVYLGEGPAPRLPRWPELESYGRFHVVELRKWNYFHDLENTVDDVHQRWVHKEGVYQDEGNADEIPEITAEETEFGLIQSTRFENGFTRRLALFMPNTLYFSSGAGVLRGFKSFLWNVPVDDVSHNMFFLFIAAHLTPEVGQTVAEGVRAARQYLSELPPVEEVVRAVLTGKKRWAEIETRPDLVLIEDGIVLLGQGVIPDRSKNRLGSSDAAIALLRKIYAREMAALGEGRPLKEFQTPEAATLSEIDSLTD